MERTVAVYKATEAFPKREMYGITSQLRRSAASVPANIAEGNGRMHAGDCLRHLSIARGSLAESETFVELALRLSYLSADQTAELVLLHQRVGQMLNKLVQSIDRK